MKRTFSLLFLLTLSVLALRPDTLRAHDDHHSRDKEYSQAELERSQLGYAMSPVPIRLISGRSRILVGLGSYLVNTACVRCHTSPVYLPGGNPLQGQPEKINAANFLAGGASFGAVIKSRNLTPDPNKNNLPAGLTLAEFKHTIRTGEDLKKLHPQLSLLLQTMPWPEMSKFSDRDLEAMYAYLRSIPHAEPGS